MRVSEQLTLIFCIVGAVSSLSTFLILWLMGRSIHDAHDRHDALQARVADIETRLSADQEESDLF